MEQKKETLDSLFKRHIVKIFVLSLVTCFGCFSLVFDELKEFVDGIHFVSDGEMNCKEDVRKLESELAREKERVSSLESKVEDLENRLTETNAACKSIIESCYPNIVPVSN
jgi:polyhydroxyalkanoate synthesis regulator phasin